MAEPDPGALSLALDTLTYIARSTYAIPWTSIISRTLRLASLPLRIAWSPVGSLVGYLAGWIALFFAPALFCLSYVRAWCRGVVAFVVGLQFSTAAIVGIIAGITLAISSLIITTYLGMQNDSSSSSPDPIKKKQQSPSTDISPTTSFSSEGEESSISIKSEDYLVEQQTPSRRHYASGGLMSQTILEEDDTDDF